MLKENYKVSGRVGWEVVGTDKNGQGSNLLLNGFMNEQATVGTGGTQISGNSTGPYTALREWFHIVGSYIQTKVDSPTNPNGATKMTQVKSKVITNQALFVAGHVGATLTFAVSGNVTAVIESIVSGTEAIVNVSQEIAQGTAFEMVLTNGTSVPTTGKTIQQIPSKVSTDVDIFSADNVGDKIVRADKTYMEVTKFIDARNVSVSSNLSIAAPEDFTLYFTSIAVLDSEIMRVNTDGGFDEHPFSVARDATNGKMTLTSRTTRLFELNSDVVVRMIGIGSSNDLNVNILTPPKDQAGNDTTITVLSGQQLKVWHEIEVEIDWDTSDYTLSIGATNHTGDIATYSTNASYDASLFTTIANPAHVGGGFYVSFNASDAASTTQAPQRDSSGSIALEPYQQGSYERIRKCQLNTSEGNGAIKVLHISNFQGQYGTMFVFDSPFTKAQTHRLTIDYVRTFGWVF